MAEEEQEQEEQTTDTSFIDKLVNGDDDGFKSDIRKHVVDAVAQQVSGVGDVSFDTSDESEDETGADDDGSEDESEDDDQDQE